MLIEEFMAVKKLRTFPGYVIYSYFKDRAFTAVKAVEPRSRASPPRIKLCSVPPSPLVSIMDIFITRGTTVYFGFHGNQCGVAMCS